MKTRYWLLSGLIVAGAALGYVVNNKGLRLHPNDAPANISGAVSTDKVKLLRTPDGTLFAIYGQAQDVPRLAYDTKSKVVR